MEIGKSMVLRCIQFALLVPMLLLGALVAAAPATSTIASAQGCGTWAQVNAHDPGSFSELSSLAILSPTDIWAIGGGGFQHNTGSGFALVPAPSLGALRGGPQAISADASNDVWAVGQKFPVQHYPPTSTLVEHFDGSFWTVVASPSPDARSNILSGVVALAPDNVWAVGQSAGRALIEHFDGASWSVTPSPALGQSSGLFAIAAAGPGSVKAIGYSSDTGGTHSLVLSFNGSGWSQDAIPDLTGSLTTITNVPNTTHYIATDASSAQSMYMFDGSRWTSRPGAGAPFQASVTGDGLISGITAISDTDVWAVGSYFDHSYVTQPFALHYNGSGWTSSFSTFSVPGGAGDLLTVGHAGAAAYVAGFDSPTSLSSGEVFAATLTC